MYGYGSRSNSTGPCLDLRRSVYVDPGDREKVQALLREHGFVERFETRMYRKDGEIRWVSMNVRAVKDEAGGTRFYEGSFEDITDRKRAEEDLRTSRLHLSDAADLARIAYWEHDEASNEFIFNDAFYALYATSADREGGYRMGEGRVYKEVRAPRRCGSAAPADGREQGPPPGDYLEEYEHRAIRRDGEVIHILTRNRAIMDEQGRLVKTVGVNQDITERKKTEEQLMVANFAMQSSISAIGLATCTARSSLSTSPGSGSGDTTGQKRSSAGPSGSLRPPAKSRRPSRPSGRAVGYMGEGVALRKDGTTFDVQFAENLVRTPDGKPVCMMASFVDISDRKRAEARLKESEERYRFLFDSISDAIFVHPLTDEGLPGHFIEVNGAACALLGWDREELIHMTPARHLEPLKGVESIQPDDEAAAGGETDGPGRSAREQGRPADPRGGQPSHLRLPGQAHRALPRSATSPNARRPRRPCRQPRPA